MNRKGFTLIELLAVIVILGIILVFVTPNILEVYKNSKLKSEEIFVDRVSQPIDSYIKLKSDDIVFTKVEGTFTKTYIDSTGNEKVDYPNIYIGKIQEKTENGEYISSYECDPETVDKEFDLSKSRYRQITGRSREIYIAVASPSVSGFVAMMISRTSSCATRCSSSRILISSWVTWFSGEMTP